MKRFAPQSRGPRSGQCPTLWLHCSQTAPGPSLLTCIAAPEALGLLRSCVTHPFRSHSPRNPRLIPQISHLPFGPHVGCQMWDPAPHSGGGGGGRWMSVLSAQPAVSQNPETIRQTGSQSKQELLYYGRSTCLNKDSCLSQRLVVYLVRAG